MQNIIESIRRTLRTARINVTLWLAHREGLVVMTDKDWTIEMRRRMGVAKRDGYEYGVDTMKEETVAAFNAILHIERLYREQADMGEEFVVEHGEVSDEDWPDLGDLNDAFWDKVQSETQVRSDSRANKYYEEGVNEEIEAALNKARRLLDVRLALPRVPEEEPVLH